MSVKDWAALAILLKAAAERYTDQTETVAELLRAISGVANDMAQVAAKEGH